VAAINANAPGGSEALGETELQAKPNHTISHDLTADELAEHPFAAAMPAMSDTECAGLLADIRAHGLRDPITLYNGQILDGRHRYRACIELGIDPPTVDFVGSDRKAQEFVLSANYHRRHLSAEQKREIIATELKRDPAQSDRAIAKKASVSDKTVGSVRKVKESTAEIPQLEKRTGLDGKERTQVVATKTPATRDFADVPESRKPSTIQKEIDANPESIRALGEQLELAALLLAWQEASQGAREAFLSARYDDVAAIHRVWREGSSKAAI
jgi:ParB-like chromosome segregation protein Spo0J